MYIKFNSIGCKNRVFDKNNNSIISNKRFMYNQMYSKYFDEETENGQLEISKEMCDMIAARISSEQLEVFLSNALGIKVLHIRRLPNGFDVLFNHERCVSFTSSDLTFRTTKAVKAIKDLEEFNETTCNSLNDAYFIVYELIEKSNIINSCDVFINDFK